MMNEDEKIEATLRKLDKTELRPHPLYGTVVPLDYYVQDCVDNNYNIHHGMAYYATKEGISEKKAFPSDMKKGIIDRSWTHVWIP